MTVTTGVTVTEQAGLSKSHRGVAAGIFNVVMVLDVFLQNLYVRIPNSVWRFLGRFHRGQDVTRVAPEHAHGVASSLDHLAVMLNREFIGVRMPFAGGHAATLNPTLTRDLTPFNALPMLDQLTTALSVATHWQRWRAYHAAQRLQRNALNYQIEQVLYNSHMPDGWYMDRYLTFADSKIFYDMQRNNLLAAMNAVIQPPAVYADYRWHSRVNFNALGDTLFVLENRAQFNGIDLPLPEATHYCAKLVLDLHALYRVLGLKTPA